MIFCFNYSTERLALYAKDLARLKDENKKLKLQISSMNDGFFSKQFDYDTLLKTLKSLKEENKKLKEQSEESPRSLTIQLNPEEKIFSYTLTGTHGEALASTKNPLTLQQALQRLENSLDNGNGAGGHIWARVGTVRGLTKSFDGDVGYSNLKQKVQG